MMKNILKKSALLGLIICAVNIKPVYADIFINKEMDKPIESSLEYEEFIKAYLYEKNFEQIDNNKINSAYKVNFYGNDFTIIYRDNAVQNEYAGTFSIFNSGIHMKIRSMKGSTKYGFLETKELKEEISIYTRLSIYEDRVNLSIQSKDVSELNFNIEAKEFVEIDQVDETMVQSINDNMRSVFINTKSWSFRNLQDNNKFSHMIFTGGNGIQLIDDSDINVIHIVDGTFKFAEDNNRFLINLDKLTKIDKQNNALSVTVLKDVDEKTQDSLLKFYKNPLNFSYEIVYVSETNRYYLGQSDGINNFKGIVPSSYAPYKNNIETATRNDVVNLLTGNDISIGEEGKKIIGSFAEDNTFQGRFIDEGGESVVKGGYLVTDGSVKIAFYKTGYFNNLETVAYNDISDDKEFFLTIDFEKLNDEIMIGSFIDTNLKELKLDKDTKNYYKAIKIESYKPRAIPQNLSNPKIEKIIDGNGYVFSESDVISGSSYKVSFGENNYVNLVISRGNVTEIVTGKYSVTNGYIEIQLDNKFYNFGKYDNYGQGKRNSEMKNTISNIKMYIKSSGDRVYFAINDGSQFMDDINLSLSNKEELIKEGSYYLANRLSDEYDTSDITPASKKDLDKDFSGQTYFARYFNGKNETFTLNSDGTVLIQFTNKNRLTSIVKGTYKFVNNKINIEYNERYYPTQDDTFTKTELNKKESFSYNITKSDLQYYIELEKGIYVNLLNMNSKVEVPVTN